MLLKTISKGGFSHLLIALGFATQLVKGQLEPDCNPLQKDCPAKKAWPKENYYIDFTKETGPPKDWTIANYEVIDFTPKGAEFTYGKKGDAPNMWTDFYMLGGRYDVEMQIAPGQGIISSAVLWSDIQDEIDWEFSGNQHGEQPFPPPDGMWTVETNIFTQGKMWDGAATYQKDAYKPTTQFHTYSVDWDENHMDWLVDNKVVRSFKASSTPYGFTFPQSPMKLQLGVWGGGDPANGYWTIQWAGGEIDMAKVPYTMYVKSVNITNKYPACEYKYTDKTGKISGIDRIQTGCGPTPSSIAKPTEKAVVATPPAKGPVNADLKAQDVGSADGVVGSSSSSSVPTLATATGGYPIKPPSTGATTGSSSKPTLESPTGGYPVSPKPSTASESSSKPTLVSPTGGYPVKPLSSAVSEPLSKPTLATGTGRYPVSSLSSKPSLESPTGGYPVSPKPSTASESSSKPTLASDTARYPVSSLSSKPTLATGTGRYPVSSLSSKPTLESPTGGYPVSPKPSTASVSSSKQVSSLSSGPTLVSPTGGYPVKSPSSAASGSSSKPTLASGTVHYPVSSLPSVAKGSSSASTLPTGTGGYPVAPPSSTGGILSTLSSLILGTSSASASLSSVAPSGTTGSLGPSDSKAVTASTISTVYSTNIYTVTSCAPTVTNCPVGQVTTELISLTTTLCPVTESRSPSSVGSSSVASLTAQPATSKGPVILPSSPLTSSIPPSLGSTQTSTSEAMPTRYTFSSEITTSILSTVYSTNLVTITSCAPTVTNCPVGQTTTEVISLYTTVCPVTNTIIDGKTFSGKADSTAPPAEATSPAAIPSSGINRNTTSQSSTSSSPVLTTSTVYTSSVYTVSTCEAGSADCSSKIGAVTTEVIPLYTTVCPVKETATNTASSKPTSSVASVSVPVTTPVYTTSTVYSTNVYTVTSCPPDVTDCPAKLGAVTTEVIAVSTTVCPVSDKSVPVDDNHTTAVITLSKTISNTVVVITSTVTFIDTIITTTSRAKTSSRTAALPSGGIYRNTTTTTSEPCTTITLGNYFTTVITYASITPSSSPTTLTSTLTPTADVPSYSISRDITNTGAMSTSTSSSSRIPTTPGQKTTTITSSVIHTIYQTLSEIPPGSSNNNCVCPPPVTMTVTATIAETTVTKTKTKTKTVEPPFPYSSGTGIPGTGTGIGTGVTRQPSDTAEAEATAAAARRWFRRHGHGHGHGHGH